MKRLVLNADLATQTINRHLFGHFAEHLGRCIYEGIWVGESSPIPNTRGIRNDVVAALRNLQIPNLRWPGGCFADEYHWQDGIGPRCLRPAMLNTHWGGVTENNHFGTHEFLELCGQLGCEPYICGNLGSGTVREMQQWLEYLTFAGNSPMADLRRQNGRQEPWRIRFWGVGNENWGCGGGMRAEYYADEYRRYQTYCRNLSGNQLYKIACGANGVDYRWTEVLMREAAPQMHGLSLHYYCGSGLHSRSATQFDEDDWFELLKRAWRLDELLNRHGAIMDQYDPGRRIGLIVDEWGAWHDVEPGTNPGFLYQQNTLRDALVAGISLNLLCAHAERVQMANIAQTVNVLQAMILTDGPAMVLTPTYHVFEMYKIHQDAKLVPTHLEAGACRWEGGEIPSLSVCASRADDGTLNLSLCSPELATSQEVLIGVRGQGVSRISGQVLTAREIQAHNTFTEPARLQPQEFTDYVAETAGLTVKVPAKSVLVLQLRT